MNWSSDDVIDYLCTLDDGKYDKYCAKLRIIFGEEGVDGKVLDQIDKPSLRDWGVKEFGDRARIHNHIQNIVNQSNNKDNNNNNANGLNMNNNGVEDEGTVVPTAFIG